jgi:two-component system, OmpR family, sensor histidine kinase KdpD
MTGAASTAAIIGGMRGGMAVNESPSNPDYRTLRWISLAMAIIAIVTGCSVLLSNVLSLANLAFLFLLPVIGVSGRHGLVPGLLTASLSALSLNFFLVPPLHTLHIADADNVVTLAILFAVALAVSNFAARLQAQASLARQKALESDTVARLTMDLGQQGDAAGMCQCLLETLAVETGCTVAVGDANDSIETAAARWALAHHEIAGRGTDIMGSADSLFLSAKVGDEGALLIRLWRGDTLSPLLPSRRTFIQTLANRCGEAIERIGVANARRLLESRERHDAMRDALLASFSHDMRTPLTTITSGLGGLEVDPANAEALAAAKEGANRLEWLFTNLVDLARIRAGAVALKVEAVDLTEAIASALDALKRQTAEREIALNIPEDTPLVQSDARLLHHILVNLIDNACKYSPTNGGLGISVRHDDDGLALSVRDSGPGLGSASAKDLFAAFGRGENVDEMPGTGLGLAIVAGFAKALGISVSGVNRTDNQGAEFTLRFPHTMVMSERAREQQ